MQQMFACPNCGNVVTYGKQYCGSCGAEMDWSAVQLPQEYQQPSYQQQQWSQQQYEQKPQTWQKPKQNWQPGKYPNQVFIFAKKKSSLVMVVLAALVIILLAVVGAGLATQGKIFMASSSDQPQATTKPTATVPPTTTPPPATTPPATTPPATTTPVPTQIATSFKVDPAVIVAGDRAILAWDVKGATTVSIDQGIGNVTVIGSQGIAPTSTTTYTLTAKNDVTSVTATTTITVNAPVKPNIIMFTATPTSINYGQLSTLAWNVTGADSVSISPNIGTVSAVDTRQVAPLGNTTYVLTATNNAGSTTASVTISVTAGSLPLITNFIATPTTISSNQSATLEWSVSGASTVTISPGVGTVTFYGSKLVTPTSTTTYLLTATSGIGSVSANVTVTVTGSTAGLPVIANFAASPTAIGNNQTASLQWTVTGATTISIDQGIGAVDAAGTRSVSPTATTIYTITATNSIGTATKTATVTVTNVSLPQITMFSASPNPIARGGTLTLSWTVSGEGVLLSLLPETGAYIGPFTQSIQVQITAATTPIIYTLTATNVAGSASNNVTVTVTP